MRIREVNLKLGKWALVDEQGKVHSVYERFDDAYRAWLDIMVKVVG